MTVDNALQTAIRDGVGLAYAGIGVRCYPGVEVRDVDAAHFLQMENPEAFNDVLRRFIEEVV
jgi:pimeloyl-ACP methyl ester carboxylesterase